MMLPILISASLAPVSYFFWAKALPGAATPTAAARPSAAARERIDGISNSRFIFVLRAFAAPAGLHTVRRGAATKSPPRAADLSGSKGAQMWCAVGSGDREG